MKNNIKILYLFHNDWDWIKQRSHFFAEGFHSSGASVHVFYKYSLKRKNLVENISSVKRYALPLIPFGFRTIYFLKIIDQIIFSLLLMILDLIYRYDLIIITHPLLFKYTSMTKSKVVYDCHDDNEEFYNDGALKTLISKEHTHALQNSHINIFSSEYLFSKYSYHKKDLVIRNGHDDLSLIKSKPRPSNDYFSIYYLDLFQTGLI